jgi:cytochrome c peroxidase
LFLSIFFFLPEISFASSLQIDVRPSFNGEPLILDSLRYQNAAGESLSVTRLSYLLSGFALERPDGSWLELTNQAAWMDAAQRRSFIRLDDLPPESFRSLRFHVGLDTNANHADPAKFAADHPLNSNLNGLHWNWQGGYIFLALEGLYRSSATNELAGISYHFANDPNRTRINLPAQIDLSHDALIALDFDLAALLNAPRPLSFARNGASTHSRTNDPVAAALAANLPGAFRMRRIESAAPTISRASNIKPLYLPGVFTPYSFKMSASFPIPDLPRDNPLIVERVTLGEKLFHETAFSKDNSLSCASCHKSGAAFSDPRRFSVGVRGQLGSRHAMPLFNLAWKSSFFWDGRAPSLRAQALMPIQDHTELDETLTNVVAKLAATPEYPKLFAAAFGSPEITPEKIGLAIEQFVLTLTSFDSKFDRAFRGETKLTAAEQRGFELFMTEYEPRMGHYGADCFHCHGGALFTDHQFHNNGLDGTNAADPGRFKVTGREADRGKFSTPSLRNVELTAPYMHDGRFKTLEEVVEHYSEHVQRSATLDPNIAKHPDGGLHLSTDDKFALVAFLKALTDDQYRPVVAAAR